MIFGLENQEFIRLTYVKLLTKYMYFTHCTSWRPRPASLRRRRTLLHLTPGKPPSSPLCPTSWCHVLPVSSELRWGRGRRCTQNYDTRRIHHGLNRRGSITSCKGRNGWGWGEEGGFGYQPALELGVKDIVSLHKSFPLIIPDRNSRRI